MSFKKLFFNEGRPVSEGLVMSEIIFYSNRIGLGLDKNFTHLEVVYENA